jgi:glycosyltransferase
MKISIITTVYNNQDRIANTVNSILSQTCPDIEYIVVDGSSTGKMPEIIGSYGMRISKYVGKPCSGIYDALNLGLRIATGEIIGILHSDDLFENENSIQLVADTFAKTNADGVFGDLVYVRKSNPKKIVRFWKSAPFDPAMLKKGWMPPHPTLFLKRDVFKKYGMYDTQYQISADYDFMLRIMSRPELKFAYLPQVITRMRMGGASNRNLKNIIRKSREDLRALRKNNIGGWSALVMKNLSKIGQFF